MTGQKRQVFFCVKKFLGMNGRMKAKLKRHSPSVRPTNAFKDAGFCVRKAQFKKAGALPTLGFVISQ